MSTKSFLAQVGMQIIALVLASISFDFTIASYNAGTSTLNITVGEKYYSKSSSGAVSVSVPLWDCDQSAYYIWKSECHSWKFLYASVILLMIFVSINILLITIRKIEPSFMAHFMKRINLVIKLSAIMALIFGLSGLISVCSSSFYYTIQVHTVVLLVFVQVPIFLGLFLEFKAIQRQLRLLDDYE